MTVMFSAISSSFMSSVPTRFWSSGWLLRRRMASFWWRAIWSAMFAFGGTGVGILPLGPSVAPSDLPTRGINGASQMKKSYVLASSRWRFLSVAIVFSSSFSTTRSAPACLALKANSPLAIMQILAFFVSGWGSSIISWILLSGFFMSTSTKFMVMSMVWLNLRGLLFSLTFLSVSMSCCVSSGIALKPRVAIA